MNNRYNKYSTVQYIILSHDWGDGTLLQCTVVYCTCRMLIHDPMSWAPDGKALLHTYIYNIHISHICMLIHISVRISYTIYIHANIYTRHHIVHFISPPPPLQVYTGIFIQVYVCVWYIFPCPTTPRLYPLYYFTCMHATVSIRLSVSPRYYSDIPKVVPANT